MVSPRILQFFFIYSYFIEMRGEINFNEKADLEAHTPLMSIGQDSTVRHPQKYNKSGDRDFSREFFLKFVSQKYKNSSFQNQHIKYPSFYKSTVTINVTGFKIYQTQRNKRSKRNLDTDSDNDENSSENDTEENAEKVENKSKKDVISIKNTDKKETIANTEPANEDEDDAEESNLITKTCKDCSKISLTESSSTPNKVTSTPDQTERQNENDIDNSNIQNTDNILDQFLNSIDKNVMETISESTQTTESNKKEDAINLKSSKKDENMKDNSDDTDETDLDKNENEISHKSKTEIKRNKDDNLEDEDDEHDTETGTTKTNSVTQKEKTKTEDHSNDIDDKESKNSAEEEDGEKEEITTKVISFAPIVTPSSTMRAFSTTAAPTTKITVSNFQTTLKKKLETQYVLQTTKIINLVTQSHKPINFPAKTVFPTAKIPIINIQPIHKKEMETPKTLQSTKKLNLITEPFKTMAFTLKTMLPYTKLPIPSFGTVVKKELETTKLIQSTKKLIVTTQIPTTKSSIKNTKKVFREFEDLETPEPLVKDNKEYYGVLRLTTKKKGGITKKSKGSITKKPAKNTNKKTNTKVAGKHKNNVKATTKKVAIKNKSVTYKKVSVPHKSPKGVTGKKGITGNIKQVTIKASARKFTPLTRKKLTTKKLSPVNKATAVRKMTTKVKIVNKKSDSKTKLTTKKIVPYKQTMKVTPTLRVTKNDETHTMKSLSPPTKVPQSSSPIIMTVKLNVIITTIRPVTTEKPTTKKPTQIVFSSQVPILPFIARAKIVPTTAKVTPQVLPISLIKPLVPIVYPVFITPPAPRFPIYTAPITFATYFGGIRPPVFPYRPGVLPVFGMSTTRPTTKLVPTATTRITTTTLVTTTTEAAYTETQGPTEDLENLFKEAEAEFSDDANKTNIKVNVDTLVEGFLGGLARGIDQTTPFVD